MNDKIDKRLNEADFWAIIERSLHQSDDIDEQEEVITAELEKLSPEEIVGFKLTLYDLANAIHTAEMWCAAYLMNDGCSDDSFDYFKNWVISRGKTVYDKAKNNPDTLVDSLGEDEYYEFETLDYVSVDAFENKTGKDLYDCLPDRVSLHPDITFNWDEDDEDSMKAICPKLFEKVDW